MYGIYVWMEVNINKQTKRWNKQIYRWGGIVLWCIDGIVGRSVYLFVFIPSHVLIYLFI
jgi:hypothetical protein